MDMFLATLYQNYVKNEQQKNTLYEQFENSIENCKKEQNRYPNTQIHDISISWRGTGISIKSGGVKLVLRAQNLPFS